MSLNISSVLLYDQELSISCTFQVFVLTLMLRFENATILADCQEKKPTVFPHGNQCPHNVWLRSDEYSRSIFLNFQPQVVLCLRKILLLLPLNLILFFFFFFLSPGEGAVCGGYCSLRDSDRLIHLHLGKNHTRSHACTKAIVLILLNINFELFAEVGNKSCVYKWSYQLNMFIRLYISIYL